MPLIEDYIVALTNLYGIVHKRKVVTIYNEKNETPISIEIIDKVMKDSKKQLEKQFVLIEDNYFMHEATYLFDDLDVELNRRQGKPHYIPPTESELLKYTDEDYVERTKQFNNLFRYVTKVFCAGDKEEAMDICLDITGQIQAETDLGSIISSFENNDGVFENEKQLNEIVQLVVEHMNNTRLWSNNGHTPNEISDYEPHFLAGSIRSNLADKLKQKRQTKLETTAIERRIKVGRNDPCSCGSGKKHKKCCMK